MNTPIDRRVLQTVGLAVLLSGAMCVTTLQAQPRNRKAAADVTSQQVRDAIERSRLWLIRQQLPDGAWRKEGESHRIGVSSLAMLSLFSSGMTPDEPEAAKGLQFLRSIDPATLRSVYEASLMLEVYATARAGEIDAARMKQLVKILEGCQVVAGDNAGLWDYGTAEGAENLGGDRSNGQFAVAALREAQAAGIPARREVWQRVGEHWTRGQERGGWAYRAGHKPIGSMTVAGIAAMSIADCLARWSDENQDQIECCGETESSKAVDAGRRWMATHFRIDRNPQQDSGLWHLYYLRGLERAGTLSGRQLFGSNDWYRQGAAYLVPLQEATGYWQSLSEFPGDTLVSTCFAMQFLSKGLAPVLIQKLEYGPTDGEQNVTSHDWNVHRHDARHLAQFIGGREKWPKSLNWQIVELPRADLGQLRQANVLLISGRKPPELTDAQAALLRKFVDQGGTIFAEPACSTKDEGFDAGFRALVAKIFPEGDKRLNALKPEHPIYRAESEIDARTVPLEGIDVGDRTAIVYSKSNDLCCLWDHWTSYTLPKRSPQTLERITRAMQMGTNIMAYATGRKLRDRLQPAP